MNLTLNSRPIAGADSFSPEEYRSLVQQNLLPHLPSESETVAIEKAVGRVLAEDFFAPADLPAFANSQMDGYALTDAACLRSDRVFTVGADVAAGSAASGLEVSNDLVYPVMTGAPLPAGYVAVVPEEKARPLGQTQGSFAVAGSRVELPRTSPDSFVRQVGSDVRAGELLIEAQTPLTPVHCALLAAHGQAEVSVHRRLRVLVLTGGDEVTSETKLASGKIRDANGPLLGRLLEGAGAQTRRVQISDDAAALLATLRQVLDEFGPDLVLSSGGISHGKFEVVKNAVGLLKTGATSGLELAASWFGHVAQQPGGPQGLILLGRGDDRPLLPWLGLPGNPVSTLVTYTLVVEPLLARWQGISLPARYGRLAEPAEIRGRAGKTEFRRARVKTVYAPDGTSSSELTVDEQTGSHLLHRASRANALVEIEPEATYSAGASLRWYPLNTPPLTQTL
ncbi:molybdopterin molybdotransferase MoeA [Rothia aerolata]|uniref:Molybdopterin molybdenumtransferase n=1 Tax=Rothia aerolata TaxID=1812262 RepID=A0A917IPN9_9MICC|nr:molybdopterin molybdotransferase MoeA [Rothia aerolata]GGH60666.1 molybdopterin biosynthesis enzyme [Rothia aerolata]